MNLVTKLTLTALVMVSLCGCNMVMTEKPMFTEADRAGAPPIRPGVWRDEKPDCEFDEAQPQKAWPECAHAQPSVGAPPIWVEAGGDPNLLQLPLQLPGGKSGAGPAGTSFYVYVAYRPLKLDAAGRVIAMKQWPVRCGPPPTPEEIMRDREKALDKGHVSDLDRPVPAPKVYLARYDDPGEGATAPTDSKDAAGRSAKLKADLAKLAADSKKLVEAMAKMSPTKAPLPGLTMNKLGGCAPASMVAVRNAARLSEAWADDNPNSHWVREAEPGDDPPATAKSLADAFNTPFPDSAPEASPPSPPAPSSPPSIEMASPLASFDWTYLGDPPGDRHWTSPDGVVWTETYPNGHSEVQNVGARGGVAGCLGVITTKTYSPTSQTFIPDPGCIPMALRFRYADQPWGVLGVMRAITVRAPP
jgi:hypothetical protein